MSDLETAVETDNKKEKMEKVVFNISVTHRRMLKELSKAYRMEGMVSRTIMNLIEDMYKQKCAKSV